jgi:hypothetical protein
MPVNKERGGAPTAWNPPYKNMITQSKPIKRSPIKKHAPKRRPGFDDPKYRAWLKEWPCLVCFAHWCEYAGTTLMLALQSQRRSSYWLLLFLRRTVQCGRTEVAHVGLRGLGQRCKDRDAMPLGSGHHRTLKDAAHVLGKKFWAYHGIDKNEALEMLRRIYKEETGNDV